MRPKRCWRSTSKDCWEKFKEKHPKTKLTQVLFVAIIRTWNEKFAEELMESGKPMKLPHGTGIVQIVKYKKISNFKKTAAGNKIIALPVDWKKTLEAGKKVYHLNSHTDGYRYIFQWRWKDSKLKFAKIFSFKMARQHSRKLAKLLLTSQQHRDKYELQVRNAK